LTGFNVSYDTTTITDDSGTAFIPLNESKSITIRKNNYFPKTLTHNFTNQNDLNTSLYQAIINISINESFSGNPVSNWILKNGSDILINTTTDSGLFYGNAGSYNSLILSSNTGAFSNRAMNSFNLSALDNISLNYEILPTELNITAFSFIGKAAIDNFTVTISSLNNSHSQTSSTILGSLVFGVINNNVYNITIDAEGYAFYDNSHLVTISGNTFHNFTLYTDNSINFSLRDEDTNNLITEEMFITLTGNITSYSITTDTGLNYTDNIIDGTYSIKIWNNNYTVRYYAVTVADRSFQHLQAYLSKNDNSTTTFSFKNKDSAEALEDVLFSAERVINGSWVTIFSKYSDVTGKVSFNYIEDEAYRFTASKNDYEVKTFSLDPIEDTSYSVTLTPDLSSIVNIDDISIIIDPYLYYEGSNNFSFIFLSPSGKLSSYNINVSYPDNNNYYLGSNSGGETFSFNFNITNTTVFDIVRIEYNYITVTGSSKSFVRLYPISLNSTGEGTFIDNNNNFYGLGLLERILIVMVIIIILAGLTYAIGGSAASIGMALIIYGAASIMGFIPIWLVIVTLVSGVIMLASFGGK
jgi:hypothetical protein